MQLSKYFSLQEFVKPEDNPLPGSVLNNLKRLAMALDAVRERNGKPMVVSSGYRNKKHNAAVGGVKDSYHTFGKAADFPRHCLSPGLIDWLKKNWSGGLGVYNWGIHLDIGPKRRW